MGRLSKQLDPTQTGFEAEKLLSDLHRRIVGQDEAVDQIVNIYQMYLAGMASPGRPIGNFLFLGPTGSGKTRMVEATAESLVGDLRAVIKIDCAEFQHSHEIVKFSFVLFDEIEKASDALWNLLLGILDKATLTLGDNRRVDFGRAMIFMTSNLGAAEMGSILRPNLGFASGEIERCRALGMVDADLNGKISRAGLDAARRKFTPEFMNRIDKTVVFKPLGENELKQILHLELNILQQRIFNSPSGSPFVFSVTDSARDYLLREGTDIKYGARHLKRAIDRSLVHPLSNLIATEQIRGGDLIRVDFDTVQSRMTFFKEAEDMPAYAMVQMVDTTLSPPMTMTASAVQEHPRVVNAKRSSR